MFVDGISALIPIVALALIEIVFSFENAVINSQVLSTMNRLWRVLFLTAGIFIAVFIVRALLPLVLVSTTLDISISEVWNLALHNPEQYSEELKNAYPVIAAFGGVFLLMVGLRFFGEKRSIKWLDSLEAPLGEFNQPWKVSILGALAAIAGLFIFIDPGNKKVALAGALGALAFLGVKFISRLLVVRQNRNRNSSHANGFSQFLYLELLDATFSFDSVIAAFAITTDITLIIAGLAIGAVFVRSTTMQMLNQGTLGHYRYLVHGAHYAILALALLLLAGIRIEIPEAATGLIGIFILLLALNSSRRHASTHRLRKT